MTNYIILNEDQLLVNLARKLPDVKLEVFLEAIKMCEVEQELKTGKWTNGDSICPCCGEDKFKGLDADVWANWQPNYCPNCGAKMSEVSKE